MFGRLTTLWVTFNLGDSFNSFIYMEKCLVDRAEENYDVVCCKHTAGWNCETKSS